MVKNYKLLYKPNQVYCGTGQTAIVTGWTIINAIKKELEEHEYGRLTNYTLQHVALIFWCVTYFGILTLGF